MAYVSNLCQTILKQSIYIYIYISLSYLFNFDDMLKYQIKTVRADFLRKKMTKPRLRSERLITYGTAMAFAKHSSLNFESRTVTRPSLKRVLEESGGTKRDRRVDVTVICDKIDRHRHLPDS